MHLIKRGFVLLAGLTMGSGLLHSRADEGMWLFNDPPKAKLKASYQFEPTAEWMEHVQKSSVRFNSGGSGSFVSEDGLVMSNHHVGADALQKLSDAKHNYYRDGFAARTAAEERPCPDLELNVLMSIENVTDRVNAAVKPDMSAEAAFGARRAVMAEIEKESLAKTGLRSDVVTLFQGGQYHLYRLKKYTDVRLVFAPEFQSAFYGGDPDNFEYPRFDLDVCFFRVYENNKPVKLQHYLKWSDHGADNDELIFVSGHPGRTSRKFTMAELEYARDVQFPMLLSWMNRTEVMLNVYSGRSGENARRAKKTLFSIQNSRKARQGGLSGLLDPKLFQAKAETEAKLRAAVDARPELAEARGAWDEIADVQRIIREQAVAYRLLEGGLGFRCEAFDIARTLYRAASERLKPNGDRLREFRESARESLEFDLFSAKPIYDDFEQVQLAAGLEYLVQQLGFKNELVVKVLAGKSPAARAAELIGGTKVSDVAFRKEIYKLSPGAMDACNDPLIQLIKTIDGEARRIRKIIEAQDERKQQAHAKIARARFALEGASGYPDATFTLRLAYGRVRGYQEGGKAVPHQTVFGGLYERAAAQENRPPFDLPTAWQKRKGSVDLSTPFNFVSDADIIGGNSGSPVINRAGEVVGLIFDGNIQSLVLDFAYSDVEARAVSVHSKGITEAIGKVYRAPWLVTELKTGHRP